MVIHLSYLSWSQTYSLANLVYQMYVYWSIQDHQIANCRRYIYQMSLTLIVILYLIVK